MEHCNIRKCERCYWLIVGGEMGELNSNKHNNYPMCQANHNNVIWNINPQDCKFKAKYEPILYHEEADHWDFVERDLEGQQNEM